MDGWNTIVSSWDGLFSGAMLVLERVNIDSPKGFRYQKGRNLKVPYILYGYSGGSGFPYPYSLVYIQLR